MPRQRVLHIIYTTDYIIPPQKRTARIMNTVQDHILDWRGQFPDAQKSGLGPHRITPTQEHVSISGLIRMARTSNSQSTAINTLAATIMHGPLRWSKTATELTPIETQFFQRSFNKIVESAMIMGYIVWRVKQGVIEIAEPGAFLLRWVSNKWHPVHSSATVSAKGSRDWHIAIYDEPATHPGRDTSTFGTALTPHNTITSRDLRSACSRSYLDALRQQALERQYLQRDRFNAAPAAFTSISKDIGNTSGNQRTWFRDVNMETSSRLAGATGPPARSSDFDALISNRADTLKRLSENTAAERRLHEKDNHDIPEDGIDLELRHREYVLTDGKTPTDTKALMSCTDAIFQYNRCRHSVLASMGVPAQAIGESVNTERNAANNRQFETAMVLFQATVRRMRQCINEILATVSPSRFPMSYAHMTPTVIDALAPILTTDAMLDGLCGIYDLPASSFDKEKISVFQEAMLTASGGDIKDRAPTGDPNEAANRENRRSAKQNKITSQSD